MRKHLSVLLSICLLIGLLCCPVLAQEEMPEAETLTEEILTEAELPAEEIPAVAEAELPAEEISAEAEAENLAEAMETLTFIIKGSNASKYAGFKAFFYNAGNTRQETEIGADGSFTFNGDRDQYDLTINDKYGQTVVNLINQSSDDSVIELNNLPDLFDVDAYLVDEYGNDISALATFSWTGIGSSPITGSRLHAIASGKEVTCTVSDLQDPTKHFDANTTLSLTVSESNNIIEFSAAQNFFSSNVQDLVTGEYLEGVTVHTRQILPGGSTYDSDCVSGEYGRFVAPVSRAWDTENSYMLISATLPGYYPAEKTIDKDTTDFLFYMISEDYAVKFEQETIQLRVGEESIPLVYTCKKNFNFKTSILDDKMYPYSENAPVTLSTGEELIVRAVAPGTAYVRIEQEGNQLNAALCRVEVLPDESEITGAYAADTKYSVDLYALQNPTRIPVTVTWDCGDAACFNNIGDYGNAIESAAFTKEVPFGLSVLDDHTLVITVSEGKLFSDFAASSYTTGIKINDEVTLTDPATGKEQLFTISIQKTVPKVTISAATINANTSRVGHYTISGAGDEFDYQYMGKWPEWLKTDKKWDSQGIKLELTKDATFTKKTTAKITVMVQRGHWEGEKFTRYWITPVTAQLNITVDTAAPKIKISPTTVTLTPGVGDSALVDLSEMDAVFTDYEIYAYLTGIYEGKTPTDAIKVYVTNKFIKILENNPPTDGKAHTYTVNFKYAKSVITSRDGGPSLVDFKITVKLLANANAVSGTVKTSGSIDLALPNSSITADISFKNINFHEQSTIKKGISVARVLKGKKPGTKGVDVENALPLFRWDFVDGNTMKISLQARDAETIRPDKYDYYVRPLLCLTEEQCVTPEPYTGTAKMPYVKLNITKTTDAKKLVPSVTLKLSGSIDTINSSTFITATPTFKNCYNYYPQASDIHFYMKDKSGTNELESMTNPFSATVENKNFVIKLTYPERIKGDAKYLLNFTPTVNETQLSASKSPIAMSVKTSAVKAVASNTKLTLFRSDPAAIAVFSINITPATATLGNVMLSSTVKTNEYFELTELPNNQYALRFAGNQIADPLAKAKSAAVKVDVFADGSRKPASLSLTVNIK